MKKYYYFILIMLLSSFMMSQPLSVQAATKSKKSTTVYTNFSDAEIKAAATRGTDKNIIGEFWKSDFANNNKELLDIVGFSTNNGNYGYTEDWLPEYLQEEIKSVTDVMAYFFYSRYSYAEDDQGYMSSVYAGWNKQHSAKINIIDNCGVCCETAMVVNYLLEGDYAETGSVMITSEYGHVYNYVKDWDGTYYLIDFTDFTSNSKDWREENVYNQWKDDICFWSGKSLRDPSCTKAALIHDTYEKGNGRTNLNLNWNYLNTGWIAAVKYENGMEGAIPSMLCDFSYQSTIMKNGVKLGKYTVRPESYGCYFPKYTTYQTLWINTSDNGYAGAKWFDGGTVELNLVPWYCDLTPKAQSKLNEETISKMKRQYNNASFTDRRNGNEVKIGTGWLLIMNKDRINNIDQYSLSELETMLGFKLKEID